MSIPSGDTPATVSTLSDLERVKSPHTSDSVDVNKRITRSASKRLMAQAIPIEPGTRLNQRSVTPSEMETSSLDARVNAHLEPHQLHSCNNNAPLFKYAQGVVIPESSSSRPWLMHWNDISPITQKGNEKAKKALKEQARDYVSKATDLEREQWLDSKMMAQKSNGSIFPALKGQDEVIAARDMPAFELLGHYAGEYHSEDTLPDLIDQYGLESISAYQLTMSNNCTLSGFGCGNICSLINAPNTSTSPPKRHRKKQSVDDVPSTPAIEANVAPIRVSFMGKECALMVLLKPVKKGDILWYDYGWKYWYQLNIVQNLGKPITDSETVSEATSSSMASKQSPEPDLNIELEEDTTSLLSDTSEDAISVYDPDDDDTGSCSDDSDPDYEVWSAQQKLSTASRKRPTTRQRSATSKKAKTTEIESSAPDSFELMPPHPQRMTVEQVQECKTYLQKLCSLFDATSLSNTPSSEVEYLGRLLAQYMPGCKYVPLRERLNEHNKQNFMHSCAEPMTQLFSNNFRMLSFFSVKSPVPCCIYLLSRFYPKLLENVKFSDIIATLKAFPTCQHLTDDAIRAGLQSNTLKFVVKSNQVEMICSVSVDKHYQKPFMTIFNVHMDTLDNCPYRRFLYSCAQIKNSDLTNLATENTVVMAAMLANLASACHKTVFRRVEGGAETEEGTPVTLSGSPQFALQTRIVVTVSEIDVGKITPEIVRKLNTYFDKETITTTQKARPYIILAALLTLIGKERLFEEEALKLFPYSSTNIKNIHQLLSRESTKSAGLIQSTGQKKKEFTVKPKLKKILEETLAEMNYKLPSQPLS